MTIEFFMFEEISVIVPFSLVKERFVSSTHLNVKKKNVLFCLEGHSTLFFVFEVHSLVTDHLMIVVSYHYIVHMQNIYKTLQPYWFKYVKHVPGIGRNCTILCSWFVMT